MVRHGKVIWYSVFVFGDNILTNLQVGVLIQMLPFNVNVNPNPRSTGAKLDVNDADLAKPIMFQTERKMVIDCLVDLLLADQET